jgi:hypothetical protein
MVNQKKELKILKLSELLPFAFGGEWLGQKSIRQLPDKSQK